jgi:hypothetical protein
MENFSKEEEKVTAKLSSVTGSILKDLVGKLKNVIRFPKSSTLLIIFDPVKKSIIFSHKDLIDHSFCEVFVKVSEWQQLMRDKERQIFLTSLQSLELEMSQKKAEVYDISFCVTDLDRIMIKTNMVKDNIEYEYGSNRLFLFDLKDAEIVHHEEPKGCKWRFSMSQDITKPFVSFITKLSEWKRQNMIVWLEKISDSKIKVVFRDETRRDRGSVPFLINNEQGGFPNNVRMNYSYHCLAKFFKIFKDSKINLVFVIDENEDLIITRTEGDIVILGKFDKIEDSE